MATQSIFLNFGAMSETSAAFKSSAEAMDTAVLDVSTAGSELTAAWIGVGAQQFEVMRGVVEGYGKKMAEVALMEANNINAAQGVFADADQEAASSIASKME